MTIQISNILIWQKNGKLRNLELEKNSVNVITGDSGKGKSSILYIIDYCLLSSTATGISKANIDDKSTWYGVRLHTSRGLVTIARPAYHTEETESVYFSDCGKIPEQPQLNMKVSSLKKILDKELGLNSDLKVPYGGRTIKAGSKITFRNFLGYCYQDQTAIVSPDSLYIKPGNLKFIERIERTFRMALGIIDAKGAIVTERLEKLKAEKISLERRSESIKNKRIDFHEDVASLEKEAISLGLLEKPKDDIYESIEALKEIASSPIEKFDNIREQLKKIELRKYEVNRKLRQFRNFNEDYRQYQKLIKESDESIRPVNYILDNYKAILPSTKSSEVLFALEEELTAIKTLWKKRNDSLLYVDVNEQCKALEAELQELNESLEKINGVVQNLSSPKEIYRYQGKLEVKVELYSSESTPIDYTDAINGVESKINQLNDAIQDIEAKREFIIGNLNEKINDHLSRLKLKGYESSKAVFLEREKAINLILDEGRAVERMVDIGSASNYLYLHLSYFMALHEVARDNQVSWMPAFLVFDQVSTPYGGETVDDIKSLDAALRELDIFVEKMNKKGGVQIILMEHIPQSHWLDLNLSNFRLVDRELIGDYGLIN